MFFNGFFNDIYIYFRDNNLKGLKVCILKYKIVQIMLEILEFMGGNFVVGGVEYRNLKFYCQKGFKLRYENIGMCNIII